MRNNYTRRAAELDAAFSAYERAHGSLPGILDPQRRETLIEQIIDSEQRVNFTTTLLTRELDPEATNPLSTAFHPLKAAVLHHRAGDLDEAVWMVYLYVHFGRHRIAGWRYIRDTYGAFGSSDQQWWTWERTAGDPTSFRFWLDEHQADYRAAPGRHGFGNHHKYGSLAAWSEQGTGAAFESYVQWVLAAGGDHRERFASLTAATPEDTFDAMYRSLSAVRQFGRIARFDYLTMLGKLSLADIRPPHTYLVGATGPLTGARQLLNNDPITGTARELQTKLTLLAAETRITPDVLEDAVCNWQKSMDRYIRFQG